MRRVVPILLSACAILSLASLPSPVQAQSEDIIVEFPTGDFVIFESTEDLYLAMIARPVTLSVICHIDQSGRVLCARAANIDSMLQLTR